MKESLGIAAIWIGALLVLTLVGAAGRVFWLEVDRRAVESSRQYAETNTEAFYVRLETARRIDVQVAALPADDPSLPALRSQRALLDSEMRREVAKIPADARTADMLTYGVAR